MSEPPLQSLDARCLSGDGSWMAGISDGKVALLDLASLTLQTLAHANPHSLLALSHDGGLLAEAGPEQLHVWHVASGRLTFEARLAATALRFRGPVLVCGGADGRALRLDFRQGEEAHAALAFTPLHCVDSSPDGQFLAGGHERGVALADVILGDTCARLDCEPASLELASPDALWVGLRDGRVRLYDLDQPFY